MSLSDSAPVVVSAPRLSIAILVAVSTPAEPVSVAALISPVNAVCDTVPDNGAAEVPRRTPPLVAVTIFTVALAAATIWIASALELVVMTVPLSVMLLLPAPPPPLMAMAPLPALIVLAVD